MRETRVRHAAHDDGGITGYGDTDTTHHPVSWQIMIKTAEKQQLTLAGHALAFSQLSLLRDKWVYYQDQLMATVHQIYIRRPTSIP